MQFKETETVELKETVTEDVKKEIIAFANTDGGEIYIGVKDDGTVVGVENPDGVALQITNMARDAIKPDITLFLHYETIYIDEKAIVKTIVQRGTERPYYLLKKGLKPEGVYVRQGYSFAPASEWSIRKMIKETDGDVYESLRSVYQELTFQEMTKEFQKRRMPFGNQQMKTLKMIDKDGLYTNLAWLLSDQCTCSTKVALFQGENSFVFLDRKEYSGSLFQQMNEIYAFLNICNKTKSTLQGLYRMDKKDYPEVAVREALMNALVHREYSISASTLIGIYDDRMEFTSVGGLPNGISEEDMRLGISVCRNQNLANIFYRLQLIEAYGTGIPKIFHAYEKETVKPSIKTSPNAFKVILPNCNYVQSAHTEVNEACAAWDPEDRIVRYAENHKWFTKKEIMALLEVSSATASRYIRKMLDKHILIQHGEARNSRYTLR